METIIYKLKNDRRVREHDTRTGETTRKVFKRGDIFEGNIISVEGDSILLLGLFGETYLLEKDYIRDVTEYETKRAEKLRIVNELRA